MEKFEGGKKEKGKESLKLKLRAGKLGFAAWATRGELCRRRLPKLVIDHGEDLKGLMFLTLKILCIAGMEFPSSRNKPSVSFRSVLFLLTRGSSHFSICITVLNRCKVLD
jgi:hypothetical protein